MTKSNMPIHILIAEDNTVSRELMASILRTQGYIIEGAADGGAAIEVVRTRSVDMALVDINMAPRGGFEFIRYLVGNAIKLPVVIITAEDSSDILMQARQLNVDNILMKPVEPGRLLKVVERTLRARGIIAKPFTVEALDVQHNPQDLMQRTLELAEENALAGKGGPYGAIITDPQGRILGMGANGIGSRADPTAHAEVMAIRQAAEKLGRSDLADCVLYCSSEPTMVSQAVIRSVGIKHVYYGLSHADVHKIREATRKVMREKFLPDTKYEQICQAEALAMFYSAMSRENEGGS